MLTVCKTVVMLPKGIYTVGEAERLGVSRMQLAELAKRGGVERLSRGVYATPGAGNVAMVEAIVLKKRATEFVVALESALRVHDFTSATPHALWIAIPRGSRTPAVDFPIEVIHANASAYRKGIEVHEFNGVRVQVYSAARTVADLFKFRGRVGLDLAIESLKTGLSKKIFSVDELMRFARLNRVANVIRPYVEGYFG